MLGFNANFKGYFDRGNPWVNVLIEMRKGSVRIYLLLVTGLCFSISLLGQSFYGGVHSPKGDLHVLLIFIRYSDQHLHNDPAWPDESKEGVLPEMARGGMNRLFNADPQTIGKPGQVRNLSNFYYTMSGKQFRLSGDIFPIQVPVKYISPSGKNFFNRQFKMNAEAILWITKNYPNFDWSRYDRRKNQPKYRYDNSDSQADGVLDYVIFMHRSPGSQGVGSPGNINIPGTRYAIRDGHTGIDSYVDAEHNWEYFKHEFAHNLFDAPHYLCANNTDGLRYYTQKGWGLMAGWHAPFFTTNAWENWWLGWLEPQEVKRNARYSLKDFVTGQDALRIAIPGTQDYLWIENHQKINTWDRKIFFNDTEKGQPASEKGIYMYVVAGPGNNRNQRLSAFNKEHANLIRMMNGEGNFDYEPTGKMLSNGYFDAPVLRKTRSNPIAGQNDFQMIRYDYNNNGRIDVGMAHGNKDRGGMEQKAMWWEESKGRDTLTLGNTGDGNDAFGPGDEIGLSGIVPVTNYPTYDRNGERLRPYLLSGIHIKVEAFEEDGTALLDIKLDDWEIRKDQRWTGNIVLDSPPQGEKESSLYGPISLIQRSNLLLDLSGTPDRLTPHPETGTFVNPTRLRIGAHRSIRIGKKSKLIIDKHSTLRLSSNAEIIIEKKGELIIRPGGKCELQAGAKIQVLKKGKIRKEEGGEIIMEAPEQLNTARGARVRGI